MHTPENELKTTINSQTAAIDWRELERFFAAGKAIFVASHLDLIDVADKLINDDVIQFKKWQQEQAVQAVSDEQALRWHSENRQVWAVVIAPWVLVQERDQAQKVD